MAPSVSPIIPVIAITMMAVPTIPMIMKPVTVPMAGRCHNRKTHRQSERSSGCEIGQSSFHVTRR
jgi:hypothetical protein